MDIAFLSSPAAIGAQSRAQLSATPVAGAQSGDIKESAKKVASEFEAMFLSTYLEGMFAGIETDGPFGGGQGEKAYRSLLLGEYAKSISASGGLGIADQVYREIIALQERDQQ